jgi:protein-disulfide isomerase
MLEFLFDHPSDHFSGDPYAPVELIEYGDFQCSDCAAIYPEIKRLQREMGSRLKFVFRHFPASAIHPLAFDAAVLTEVAASRGKFWYMHDLIYEHQTDLSGRALSKFAKYIGLDADAFEKGDYPQQVIRKVYRDLEMGIKDQVNETPTFFINGNKYTGSADFESLYEACEFVLTFSRAA